MQKVCALVAAARWSSRCKPTRSVGSAMQISFSKLNEVERSVWLSGLRIFGVYQIRSFCLCLKKL